MLTSHNLINYQNVFQIIGNIETLKKWPSCEQEKPGNVLGSKRISLGFET